MSTDGGSGNRWEPSPQDAGGADDATGRPEQPVPEPPTADHPAAQPAQFGAPPAASPASPARADWREGLPARRGLLAAGVAAVVFFVGGAGGFMIGHATAGSTQDGDRFGQQGPPGGFGPDGNGVPGGQMPGTPPRSDDRRGDDSGPDGSGT